jgi:hypothetical protein
MVSWKRFALAMVLASVAAIGAILLYLLWRFDPSQSRLWGCTFHAITGLLCPGCGATRATHELLHGRLLSALQYNAFLVTVLPLVAYGTVADGLRLARGRGLKHAPFENPRLLIALAVAALLFGILRNIPAYPWTLLAPQ